MRYCRMGILISALSIFSQIGCEHSEPDIVLEARRYISGSVLIPWHLLPRQERKAMNYYYVRTAWDNRDPRLFEHLSEDELRMFEAMLHLSEGQVLLAFKQLRRMQYDGYPRSRVLQRVAVFLTQSPHDGAEAAAPEAVRAERDAPELVLTDDELYYLFWSFPEVSGENKRPGSPVTPVFQFVSMFPHERATKRLLESDEYIRIERSPMETFTVTAPGEPINFEDLINVKLGPSLIDDTSLNEVLNRVSTGQPVSQQSIAMALWAYADPSRRDIAALNLLLDELGNLDSLIDINEILQYSWDVELIVAPWYLLEGVIRSGYYAGRYEVALDAFERLVLMDGSQDGEKLWFLKLYLYGAACLAGLGDLERASNLLETYLDYASIYSPTYADINIEDFDSTEEWRAAREAESIRQSSYDADYLDIFHALVWYYLMAREFDAFIDTPYDTRIENLFAARFELSDVDFVAGDGRSGPSEELIAAYERVAAEQE